MKSFLKRVLLVGAAVVSLGVGQAKADDLFVALGAVPTFLASSTGSIATGGTSGGWAYTISATGQPGVQGLSSNTLDINLVSGASTFDVWVSQVGLTSPLGTVNFTSGFTENLITAGWSVTQTTYLDTGNVTYGTGTLLGSATFTAIGTETDYASFSTGAGPYSLTHHYAITASGAGNANSTVNLMVSAVPEPETYAMLLAGLGLMGFVARRRKQKAA